VVWASSLLVVCFFACFAYSYCPEDGGDSSSEIFFYFHWTISQKVKVFVVTTVKISNPTEGKGVQL
jgi:hypothetical protein